MTAPPLVLVNLIAGPLGAGKTTLIRDLLSRRPEGERWAVLVNEYGLVGLDAALLGGEAGPAGDDGVEIREVAGGCICCSAGLMFGVALARLLHREPDRLLIEPTGLAALSGILDTLDRPGTRELVDVRSVVCLVDPARLSTDLRREEVRDQVEAAEVLLASRADLATPAELSRFRRWSDSLFPPKRRVGIVKNGEFDPEWLDLVRDRRTVVRRAGHAHGTDHPAPTGTAPRAEPAIVGADADPGCGEGRPIAVRVHRSDTISTIGWVCWSELVFDADRASTWMSDLARLPGARRVKAVLRTPDGWLAWNVASGVKEVKPSHHRSDSRVEVVLEHAHFPDANELERRMRGLVVPR